MWEGEKDASFSQNSLGNSHKLWLNHFILISNFNQSYASKKDSLSCNICIFCQKTQKKTEIKFLANLFPKKTNKQNWLNWLYLSDY